MKVLNDWSAHAQAIIYTRPDPVGKLDLWHVPLAGGAARPLLDSASNEAQARISPDGRWLAARFRKVYSGHMGDSSVQRALS